MFKIWRKCLGKGRNKRSGKTRNNTPYSFTLIDRLTQPMKKEKQGPGCAQPNFIQTNKQSPPTEICRNVSCIYFKPPCFSCAVVSLFTVRVNQPMTNRCAARTPTNRGGSTSAFLKTPQETLSHKRH